MADYGTLPPAPRPPPPAGARPPPSGGGGLPAPPLLSSMLAGPGSPIGGARPPPPSSGKGGTLTSPIAPVAPMGGVPAAPPMAPPLSPMGGPAPPKAPLLTNPPTAPPMGAASPPTSPKAFSPNFPASPGPSAPAKPPVTPASPKGHVVTSPKSNPDASMRDLRHSHKESLVDLGEWEDKSFIWQGYVMKRMGIGADSTHYWEVRYLTLEPNRLLWWTSHFMDNKKGSMKLKPGVSVCMTFDREKFDEGRRSAVFGIASKEKRTPIILDCQDHAKKNEWLKAFEGQGYKHIGHVYPSKKNPSSVREGWLMKKGAVWHTRYLVLLPQMICYFKWKGDKSPQAVIPIAKKTNAKMVTDKEERTFSIVDVSNEKEYLFKCYDRAHCLSWIEDINAAALKM